MYCRSFAEKLSLYFVPKKKTVVKLVTNSPECFPTAKNLMPNLLEIVALDTTTCGCFCKTDGIKVENCECEGSTTTTQPETTTSEPETTTSEPETTTKGLFTNYITVLLITFRM